MMNEQELKLVLKDHSLWLKTDGKQGKRADLTGADLTRTQENGD